MPPWEIKKSYQRETIDPFTLPEHQGFLGALDRIGEVYNELRKISPEAKDMCADWLHVLISYSYEALNMAEDEDAEEVREETI